MNETVKWAYIENIITIAATVAVIVGAYAFGAGVNSWWGLVFLLNLNTIQIK